MVGGEVLRHALHVLFLLLGEPIQPGGTRLDLAGLERRQKGRDGRGDVAHHGGGDGPVAVDLGRQDVELNESRPRRPRWALAVAQEPVQPRADQHHGIGVRQGVRPGRRRRLRVVVRQQPLGHGHGLEWDAGLLDEGTDVGVRLRVRRALAQEDEGPLRPGEQVQGAPDRFRVGRLPRRRIDHADQRPRPGLAVQGGSQHVAREI